MFEGALSWYHIVAAGFVWRLVSIFISTPLAASAARKYADRSPAAGETKEQCDKRKTQLSRFGSSYVTSFIHSCVVSSLSLWHLVQLWNAPIDLQTQLDIHSDLSTLDPITRAQFVAAGRAEIPTACIIWGYLANDSVDILLNYPKLGGYDMVLHHLFFQTCCGLAGLINAFPFAFAWLTIGEASTPFLNWRWFLIQSGRGDSWTMVLVTWMFALAFFLTRIVLYWTGISKLWGSQVNYAINELEKPAWAVWSITAIILGGALLNVVWFAHIVPMCLRGGRRGSKKATKQN